MAKLKKTATISTKILLKNVTSKFEMIPKKLTKQVISTFLSTIADNIAQNKQVRIDQLGVLKIKLRAARTGRNPKTGEAIQISATKKIMLKPSVSLKESVTGISKKKRVVQIKKSLVKKKK